MEKEKADSFYANMFRPLEGATIIRGSAFIEDSPEKKDDVWPYLEVVLSGGGIMRLIPAKEGGPAEAYLERAPDSAGQR